MSRTTSVGAGKGQNASRRAGDCLPGPPVTQEQSFGVSAGILPLLVCVRPEVILSSARSGSRANQVQGSGEGEDEVSAGFRWCG